VFHGEADYSGSSKAVGGDNGDPATKIAATVNNGKFTSVGVGKAITNLLTGTNALNIAQLTGWPDMGSAGIVVPQAAHATNADIAASGWPTNWPSAAITNLWYTNISYVAVTNSPWLTNGQTFNGSSITNLQSTNIVGTITASTATNLVGIASTNIAKLNGTNVFLAPTNAFVNITASRLVMPTGSAGINIGFAQLYTDANNFFIYPNGTKSLYFQSDAGSGATFQRGVMIGENCTVNGSIVVTSGLTSYSDVSLVGAGSDLRVGGIATIGGPLTVTNSATATNLVNY